MSDIGIAVKVKAGLVTTIANSVYSSALMKVREAMSNSIDSKATRCSFFLKRESIEDDTEKIILSLLDNGKGISEGRFFEIFSSIGYGLERTDQGAYSYFGLGLMSIFKLGHKVIILSKSEEDGITKKVEIDSYQFFHKENEDKDISELAQYVTYSLSSPAERDKLSPLPQDSFVAVINGDDTSFTEIIIDGVYPEDYSEIISGGFEEEVRKHAPLPFKEDDPFFDYLKPEDKVTVTELLSNADYFPTISYFYGIQEKDNLKQLYKYFPTFAIGQKKLELYKNGIFDGYAMYVLHSISDLQPQEDNKDSGLWIRNKNFLVKPSDLLMYQGAKRIIHEPLASWIFAEISHQNMKEFLEVTRGQFVVKSEEFKQFRRSVESEISPLNARLRKIYDYGVQRVKLISDPFEAIGSGGDDDPFAKAQRKLFSLVKGDSREAVVAEIVGTLAQISSPELEAAPDVVDKIREKQDDILLEDSDDAYIYIDPANQSLNPLILFDVVTNRTRISIPPTVFNTRHVTFVGDQYDVHFVDGKGIESGISFNRETRRIYVNIFSTEIKNYSISFLDMLLIVEYGYKTSETPLEMRTTILKLLGGDFKKITEIYTNLSDNID